MSTQTRHSTPAEPPAPPRRGPEPSLGAPREHLRPADPRSPVNGESGRPATDPVRDPGGAAWLLVLPVLCCGGPLLLAAAASAGALGWGALGAVIAVLITGGVLIARRRAGRGCSPATGSSRRDPDAAGRDLSR